MFSFAKLGITFLWTSDTSFHPDTVCGKTGPESYKILKLNGPVQSLQQRSNAIPLQIRHICDPTELQKDKLHTLIHKNNSVLIREAALDQPTDLTIIKAWSRSTLPIR